MKNRILQLVRNEILQEMKEIAEQIQDDECKLTPEEIEEKVRSEWADWFEWNNWRDWKNWRNWGNWRDWSN
jgi:hypothetical protein